MKWQDVVFGVGSILFALALIPSLLSGNKPALLTSLVTGSVLAVFAGAYASLHLDYAAATTAVLSLGWVALLSQVIYAKLSGKKT